MKSMILFDVLCHAFTQLVAACAPLASVKSKWRGTVYQVGEECFLQHSAREHEDYAAEQEHGVLYSNINYRRQQHRVSETRRLGTAGVDLVAPAFHIAVAAA